MEGFLVAIWTQTRSTGKLYLSLPQFSPFYLGAIATKWSHQSSCRIIIHVEMDPAYGAFAHLTFSFGCLAANVALQSKFISSRIIWGSPS